MQNTLNTLYLHQCTVTHLAVVTKLCETPSKFSVFNVVTIFIETSYSSISINESMNLLI